MDVEGGVRRGDLWMMSIPPMRFTIPSAVPNGDQNANPLESHHDTNTNKQLKKPKLPREVFAPQEGEIDGANK